MMSALLVMALVLVVGTRASDALEVRQQEVILANLPEPDAVAYYHLLRRRLRKTMALRIIALLAAVTLVYCYKHRLGDKAVPPAVRQSRS
jgi:hypothetical protein